MVFGADTYRLFARLLALSTAESEARDLWVTRMRNLPATVVSTTLQTPLDWPDATVVSGDPADIVGRGAADFDLDLIESRTLDGHIQELTYRPTLHSRQSAHRPHGEPARCPADGAGLSPVSIWTCSLLRDKSQSRRGRIICHHAFNSRFAVAAVLGAVGGIDARAQLSLVVADVFDGNLGLQARDADACSSRFHHVTEPAAVTSVPGPHVDLPTGAHNPYRHLSARCPVGALGGDLQLFGATDSLQLVWRPGDGHDGELLFGPQRGRHSAS
jgi:hypothetical protein